MTDNARKTSELPTANTIGSSDRLVFLYQANTSTPSTRTITLGNLANSLAISSNRLTSGPNANNANNPGPYYFTLDSNSVVTFSSAYSNGTVGQIGAAEGNNAPGIDYASSNGSLYTSLTYTLEGGSIAAGLGTGYAYLQYTGGYNTPNGANGIAFYVQTNVGGANGTFGPIWSFFPDGSLQLPQLIANTTNPNPGTFIFNDGTILNSNAHVVSNAVFGYHTGSGSYTIYTASSPAVVAAKVTVRVQNENNLRTEIFTVDIVKDNANAAFVVSGQVTSNTSYGASVISAGKDANNRLFVSHSDPSNRGNAYTVKATEFTNNY